MSQSRHSPDFTRVASAHRMVGHTFWNLIGMGLPMVVGAIAFPVMLNETYGLGKERLEVLGLVWMFVGFSSIFDLGLGRALTRSFAERLSREQTHTLTALFWTALAMIACLGVLTGVIILGVIPLLTRDLAAAMMTETRIGFYIVAGAMPIIILNVALVGVLQACQRFRMLNLIRIPAGSFTFLGPLCVLPFSRNIALVVLVLILGRLVEMGAYFAGCLRALPALRHGGAIRRAEAQALLGFGSWMTVSNITVSLMTHLNRFIIRTVCRIGEGAYYLIPEEIVIRLLMFPRALIDVLFPAFVTSFHSKDDDPAALFGRGAMTLVLVTFPICLLVAVFAPAVFAVWLPDGAVFAARSAFVVRCLVVGVFIHGVARMAWFFIQAAGHPGVSARLHLVELPLFVVGAYLLIRAYGVEGAAVAWTLRSVADCLLLLLLTAPFLTHARRCIARIVMMTGAASAVIALCGLASTLLSNVVAAVALTTLFYGVTWRWVLSPGERQTVLDLLKMLRRRR